MKKEKTKRRVGMSPAMAVGGLLLGAGLLVWPQTAAEGARQGLTACGAVLIPSLFPFLVLSGLVASGGGMSVLTLPAGWLGRFLYRAPGSLGGAVLLSWIGGYPAGAKVLAQLLEEEKITPEDAEMALCFCVNSGPAFMTGVVGTGIFGSPAVGLGLFGCQLAAGAITGRVLLRKRKFSSLALRRNVLSDKKEPGAAVLVRSVSGAASAMMGICAFAVFFSALGGVLEGCGLLAASGEVLSALSGGRLSPGGACALVRGMLEICSGSAAAMELPPTQAVLILPFLLSFGGLSVLCQIAACFPPGKVKMGLFFRARVIHGMLTQLLAAPWLLARCAAVGAYAAGGRVLTGDGTTAAGTVCLLGMCAILFLTLEGEELPPPG